jgi:hypothetical protein
MLRERTLLQERQARAQSLERIRRRAEQIGLRPITDDQVRYMEIEEGTGDREQGTGEGIGDGEQGTAPASSPGTP